MAVPKYDEMYKACLMTLSDGKEKKVDDIRNGVAAFMGVTDEDRKVLLPSGKQPMFTNRMGWAITFLKKAGLVNNQRRGYYFITEEGLRVLAENPGRIDNAYLSRFPSFVEFKAVQKTAAAPSLPQTASADDSGQTPLDAMEEAYQAINASLRDEVLEEVLRQSPAFFEHLVVKLLTEMGYGGSLEDAGIVTKISGDEGIDGIIREDKLGFDKIYIQAKRWKPESAVSRPELHKFAGALLGQGASKGLFITTSRFSKEARDYADKQMTSKIVLIDGNDLARLMVEYNVGISTEAVYAIKKIDSDFFADAAS